MQYGLLIGGACNGLVVENNYFGRCRHGLSTGTSDRGHTKGLMVRNNRIVGGGSAGLDTHDNGYCVVFEGNQIEMVSGVDTMHDLNNTAIQVRSPYSIVRNNTISCFGDVAGGGQPDGIVLLGSGAEVRGNIINTDFRGVRLGSNAGGTNDAIIVDNTIKAKAGCVDIGNASYLQILDNKLLRQTPFWTAQGNGVIYGNVPAFDEVDIFNNYIPAVSAPSDNSLRLLASPSTSVRFNNNRCPGYGTGDNGALLAGGVTDVEQIGNTTDP
jgi:hypothetical protein